ncbi:MAG TPA: DoxX family protein [Myxococcales bacterium]|nr:DoxX family protein [Myxococcales bacterium]
MKATNRVLWTLQALLALLFLFAGTSKFYMPAEQLTQGGLSLGFVRFIGVCETLGGIGVIVPALTRIRPSLTPLAASGLTLIMIGATIVTLRTPMAATAWIPFLVGVFAAFVAYGRWRLVPIAGRPGHVTA